MQITEYVCDECGKKRSSDVNHWRSIIVLLSSEGNGRRFLASELTDEFPSLCGIDRAHVCGQDCAVKVFSRWLSTGKLKEGKNEQV